MVKKMEALESQLKEDLDRDIGEATQKLRNQINSKGNFPSFLIDFAKDNNLMEHATSLKRDKTGIAIDIQEVGIDSFIRLLLKWYTREAR